MAEHLRDLMLMIFFMMLTGFVLAKRGVISKEGKNTLVNLIINLLLPCNIINAFRMDLSIEELQAMWKVLLISVGIQLFYVVLTKVLFNRFSEEEKPVYQYATVCSNAGFLGNPIAQGVFGDLGLLYASIFLIPQRIVMWTAGVSYFTKTKNFAETVRKVLLHPCIVAVEIGIVFFLFQIQLPTALDKTLISFSGCCTGMTMLYIGVVLADVDFRTLITPKQLYFAALRLFLIPAAVYGVLALLHVDTLVTGVCVLLTAMPAGNTTAILASKYHADEETAAKCVVLTTTLSIISTPIWSVMLTGNL